MLYFWIFMTAMVHGPLCTNWGPNCVSRWKGDLYNFLCWIKYYLSNSWGSHQSRVIVSFGPRAGVIAFWLDWNSLEQRTDSYRYLSGNRAVIWMELVSVWYDNPFTTAAPTAAGSAYSFYATIWIFSLFSNYRSTCLYLRVAQLWVFIMIHHFEPYRIK